MTRTWARHSTLLLLLCVYTFNFIDRTIVNILQQPLKIELGLSDAQLGLLSGTAFAIFYSILGIPIARVAERRDRTRIIGIAIAAWSIFTMLCAAASGFTQLFLLRIGVGVGEAGGTPPAHSLIADLYLSDRRSTAMAVYSLGVPLGVLFGALAGGTVGGLFGWRAAFLMVGAPGILLAAAVLLRLRDPRGRQAVSAPVEEPPPLLAAIASLVARRTFVHLVAGITIASLAGYGILAFTAPFFMRAFGFALPAAGLATGVTTGVAAGLGTMAGGLASDWAGRRDARYRVWVPAAGLLLAAVLSAAAYAQGRSSIATALLIGSGLGQFLYLGPTYALVQTLAGARMRATASALTLLTVNLVGLGVGPPLTGWLSDRFAAAAYDGPYLRVCSGTSTASSIACAAASAEGLRCALTATSALFLWAAIHYVLAARTLRAELATAS